MKHLVIMAKQPQAGQVKTRLAHDIGTSEALRIYRCVLADTLRNIGKDLRWHTWLAVTPDSTVTSPVWPDHVDIITQGNGDLGARMQRIFDCLPPGPVIIIGSDIPGVTRGEIAHGFDDLGDKDAVIGPAPDGGYWLIGLKRFPRIARPFGGVRWSSKHALQDTMRNLSGLRTGVLPARRDLDTINDYRAWLSGKLR